MSAEDSEVKKIIEAICEKYSSTEISKLKLFLYNISMPIHESFINLAVIEESEHKKREQIFNEEGLLGLKTPSFGDTLQKFTDQRLSSFENIHNSQKIIPLDDIFKSKDSNNSDKQTFSHILIEGRAGIGKTTLCQYFANQWALKKEDQNKVISWVSDFDVLIRLPLRLLHYCSDTITLSELVQKACFEEERQEEFSTDSIQNNLLNNKQLKILYLLDGFDEVASLFNDDNSKRGSILRLLLKKSHWILTSRPYQAPLISLSNIRHLENVGFIDSDIKTYALRFFGRIIPEKKNQQAQSLFEFLLTNPSVKGIAHIPINLELICGIWIQKGFKDTLNFITLTTLYTKIEVHLLERYLKKLADLGLEKISTNLTSKQIKEHKRCKKIIDFMKKLAWEAMQQENNSLIIKPNVIQPLVNEYFPEKKGLTKEEEIVEEKEQNEFVEAIFKYVGLLKPINLPTSNLLEQDYYFVHLTFQEFFSAYYWVELFTGSKEDKERASTILREHKLDQRYEFVWWFASGLLNENHPNMCDQFFDLFMSHPKDALNIYHSGLAIRCLHECIGWKNINSSQEIVTRMKELTKFSVEKDIEHDNSLLTFIIKTWRCCPKIFIGSETEDMLIKNIESKNKHLRLRCIEVLGQIGIKSVKLISSLLAYFRDGEEYTKGYAAEALGGISVNDQNVIKTLVNYLDRDHPFLISGGELYEELGVVKALVQICEEPNKALLPLVKAVSDAGEDTDDDEFEEKGSSYEIAQSVREWIKKQDSNNIFQQILKIFYDSVTSWGTKTAILFILYRMKNMENIVLKLSLSVLKECIPDDQMLKNTFDKLKGVRKIFPILFELRLKQKKWDFLYEELLIEILNKTNDVTFYAMICALIPEEIIKMKNLFIPLIDFINDTNVSGKKLLPIDWKTSSREKICLNKESIPSIKISLLTSLHNLNCLSFDPLKPLIITYLNSPDKLTRRDTIYYLAHFGKKDLAIINRLLSINDKDTYIIQVLCYAFSQIGIISDKSIDFLFCYSKINFYERPDFQSSHREVEKTCLIALKNIFKLLKKDENSLKLYLNRILDNLLELLDFAENKREIVEFISKFMSFNKIIDRRIVESLIPYAFTELSRNSYGYFEWPASDNMKAAMQYLSSHNLTEHLESLASQFSGKFLISPILTSTPMLSILKFYLDDTNPRMNKLYVVYNKAFNEQLPIYYYAGRIHYINNATHTSLEVPKTKKQIVFKHFNDISLLFFNNYQAFNEFCTRWLEKIKYKEIAHQLQQEEMAGLEKSLSFLTSIRNTPKLTDDKVFPIKEKQLLEIDTPHDGSCLFYSIVLSILLPLVNQEAEFERKFIQLFGEVNKPGMGDLKSLLKQYDGSLDFIEYQMPQLEVLVDTEFRQRLAAFMKMNEKFFSNFFDETETFEHRLKTIVRPKIWGDHWEIEAASIFLNIKINILEYRGEKLIKRESHGEDFLTEISLIFTPASDKKGSAKNHYHYLLERRFLIGFNSDRIKALPTAKGELKMSNENPDLSIVKPRSGSTSPPISPQHQISAPLTISGSSATSPRKHFSSLPGTPFPNVPGMPVPDEIFGLSIVKPSSGSTSKSISPELKTPLPAIAGESLATPVPIFTSPQRQISAPLTISGSLATSPRKHFSPLPGTQVPDEIRRASTDKSSPTPSLIPAQHKISPQTLAVSPVLPLSPLASNFLTFRRSIDLAFSSLEEKTVEIAVNPREFGVAEDGLSHKIIKMKREAGKGKINERQVTSYLSGLPSSEIIRVRKETDTYFGYSALHWCARYDCAEIIESLRARGVKLDIVDKNGLNPMQLAALVGSRTSFMTEFKKSLSFSTLQVQFKESPSNPESHFEVNELHLALLGKQVELVNDIYEVYRQKAHHNINPEILKIGNLLHLIIYISVSEEKSKIYFSVSAVNLMQLILRQYNKEEIKKLLEESKNNIEQCTPLVLAAKYGQIGVAQELINYLKTHVDEGNGLGQMQNAFYAAATNGQNDFVELFIHYYRFMPSNQHKEYNKTMAYLAEKIRKGDEESERYELIDTLIKDEGAREYINQYIPSDTQQQDYEGLVLAGGGGKGFIFPYALKALNYCCDMRSQRAAHSGQQASLRFDQIKRVAGTSAGAIFGLGIAIGYTLEEIENQLEYDFALFLESEHLDQVVKALNTDEPSIKKILDEVLQDLGFSLERIKTIYERTQSSRHPVLTGIWESAKHPMELYGEITKAMEKLKGLYKNFSGFSSGKVAYAFLKKLIGDKKLSPDLTFGELADLVKLDGKKYKHLHVVVTNFTQGHFEVLSSENPIYRNYVVLDAVRASMSYPIVFKPHHLRIKEGTQFKTLQDEYIDGGVLRNFAIDEFDFKRYSNTDWPGDPDHPGLNKRTIGIRFKEEEAAVIDPASQTDLLSKLNGFIRIYMQAESLIGGYMDREYHRSIEMDTGRITTFTFKKLDEEEKAFLERRAKIGVRRFFFGRGFNEARQMQLFGKTLLDKSWDSDEEKEAKAPQIGGGHTLVKK